MAISVSSGRSIAAMVVVMGVAGNNASAGPTPTTVVGVTADENGNGTFNFPGTGTFPMPSSMTADISFGGLPSALFYATTNLPPSLVLGDLLISEVVGGPVSDVIRFSFSNAGGGPGFFFYSDIDGVIDGLADVGLPTSPVPNNNTFGVETTLPDGSTGLVYHPHPGEPGYVNGYDVTYTFISDLVPAPGAAAMLGLGGLMAARRRRW